ncbi:MAG: hypothetical protein QW797_05350 [Thermoproteota archaeon]
MTVQANPSTDIWGNATHVSIRVNASLLNSVLVELFLVNNVSSTVFKPQSVRVCVNNSELNVNYDARIRGVFPLEATSIVEAGEAFRSDLVKYLQSLILLAAGITLLAYDVFIWRRRGKRLLENMWESGVPPKGSRLSEDALLLLASRNPDAYRMALNMVLKGELKVERRRGFRGILKKMKLVKN